jgi:hypothetical protein
MTTQPGETRCDFTDLLTSQCAHCTGRTGDRPTAPPARHDTPPPSRGSRRPTGPHICLSCGGGIISGQAEEPVPITRGPRRGSARYRHTRLEDCRAALDRPPGGNTALIGRYQELPSVRVVRSGWHSQEPGPELE